MFSQKQKQGATVAPKNSAVYTAQVLPKLSWTQFALKHKVEGLEEKSRSQVGFAAVVDLLNHCTYRQGRCTASGKCKRLHIIQQQCMSESPLDNYVLTVANYLHIVDISASAEWSYTKACWDLWCWGIFTKSRDVCDFVALASHYLPVPESVFPKDYPLEWPGLTAGTGFSRDRGYITLRVTKHWQAQTDRDVPQQATKTAKLATDQVVEPKKNKKVKIVTCSGDSSAKVEEIKQALPSQVEDSSAFHETEGCTNNPFAGMELKDLITPDVNSELLYTATDAEVKNIDQITDQIGKEIEVGKQVCEAIASKIVKLQETPNIEQLVSENLRQLAYLAGDRLEPYLRSKLAVPLVPQAVRGLEQLQVTGELQRLIQALQQSIKDHPVRGPSLIVQPLSICRQFAEQFMVESVLDAYIEDDMVIAVQKDREVLYPIADSVGLEPIGLVLMRRLMQTRDIATAFICAQSLQGFLVETPLTTFNLKLDDTSHCYASPSINLDKLNRDWGTNFTSCAGTNRHGIMATFRKNLEKQIVDKLPSFVSIGSTITRDLTRAKRVHSMCPTVIPSDSAHQSKIDSNYHNLGGYYICKGRCGAPLLAQSRHFNQPYCVLHSLCRHKLSECDCQARSFGLVENGERLLSTFKYYVSTHSGYYLESDDYANLPFGAQVYGIHHQFDELSVDQYQGELVEVSYEEDGNLRMDILDHKPFIHKPWLFRDGDQLQISRDMVLTYKQLFRCRDQVVSVQTVEHGFSGASVFGGPNYGRITWDQVLVEASNSAQATFASVKGIPKKIYGRVMVSNLISECCGHILANHKNKSDEEIIGLIQKWLLTRNKVKGLTIQEVMNLHSEITPQILHAVRVNDNVTSIRCRQIKRDYAYETNFTWLPRCQNRFSQEVLDTVSKHVFSTTTYSIVGAPLSIIRGAIDVLKLYKRRFAELKILNQAALGRNQIPEFIGRIFRSYDLAVKPNDRLSNQWFSVVGLGTEWTFLEARSSFRQTKRVTPMAPEPTPAVQKKHTGQAIHIKGGLDLKQFLNICSKDCSHYPAKCHQDGIADPHQLYYHLVTSGQTMMFQLDQVRVFTCFLCGLPHIKKFQHLTQIPAKHLANLLLKRKNFVFTANVSEIHFNDGSRHLDFEYNAGSVKWQERQCQSECSFGWTVVDAPKATPSTLRLSTGTYSLELPLKNLTIKQEAAVAKPKDNVQFTVTSDPNVLAEYCAQFEQYYFDLEFDSRHLGKKSQGPPKLSSVLRAIQLLNGVEGLIYIPQWEKLSDEAIVVKSLANKELIGFQTANDSHILAQIPGIKIVDLAKNWLNKYGINAIGLGAAADQSGYPIPKIDLDYSVWFKPVNPQDKNFATLVEYMKYDVLCLPHIDRHTVVQQGADDLVINGCMRIDKNEAAIKNISQECDCGATLLHLSREPAKWSKHLYDLGGDGDCVLRCLLAQACIQSGVLKKLPPKIQKKPWHDVKHAVMEWYNGPHSDSFDLRNGMTIEQACWLAGESGCNLTISSCHFPSVTYNHLTCQLSRTPESSSVPKGAHIHICSQITTHCYVPGGVVIGDAFRELKTSAKMVDQHSHGCRVSQEISDQLCHSFKPEDLYNISATGLIEQCPLVHYYKQSKPVLSRQCIAGDLGNSATGDSSQFDSEERLILPSYCYGCGVDTHFNGHERLRLHRVPHELKYCQPTDGTAYQIGPIISELPYVTRNCLHNQISSGNARHSQVYLLPDSHELQNFMNWIPTWYEHSVRPYFKECEDSLTIEYLELIYKYIQEGGFTSATKKKYRKQLGELVNLDRDATNYVETFLKREILLKKTAPRRIQSRDNGFKLLTQPMIQQVISQMEHLPWYIGKIHPNHRGDWIYNILGHHSNLIEIDYERYDAHEHLGLLWVEYYVISRVLGPQFAKFWWDNVLVQSNAHFMSNRSYKYSVVGTRMSGESTTSFGNTMINHAVSSYVLARLGLRGAVVPFGDDGLIGYDGKAELEQITHFYSALGLKVKAKLVNWDTAGFLSCQFYQINGHVVMMRDPVKALVKLPWTHKKIYDNPKLRGQYLGAKMLSLLFESPGFTPFIDLYLRLQDIGGIPDDVDISQYQTELPYTLREWIDSSHISLQRDPAITEMVKDRYRHFDWDGLDCFIKKMKNWSDKAELPSQIEGLKFFHNQLGGYLEYINSGNSYQAPKYHTVFPMRYVPPTVAMVISFIDKAKGHELRPDTHAVR